MEAFDSFKRKKSHRVKATQNTRRRRKAIVDKSRKRKRMRKKSNIVREKKSVTDGNRLRPCANRFSPFHSIFFGFTEFPAVLFGDEPTGVLDG